MPENTQYDRVREITDQLETGLAALFESDAYKTYLTTLSKFHDYSLNNTILIAMQKPDATLVAGYSSWQKQFGRQVNKGEKAIRILAPTPYKQKVEVDKTDPNTGEILFNPDGSTQKEVQEILRPAFKVVNVFDVSQTDGRELPTIGVNELTGDVQQFEMFFEALKCTCPVPMEFEQIGSGAKGYYHQVDRRIAIQSGMSQTQTIKTAIHEMAHQKLHAINPELGKPEPGQDILTRNGKEVEAESVAYTVCQHYGIDTSDYSFAYIAGWSHGKETPELKASLNTIRTAASEMISEIDGHMQELLQERDAIAADKDAVVEMAPEKTEAAYRVGDHFLEIHEAVDGSWDFTVYGHNYREIDGGQIGEPGSMAMDYAVKEIVDFYRLSGPPVDMDRDLLGGLTELYDPTKCDEQIHFMGEMSEQGFDPREFWVNSQPMDLTAQRLSADQVSEICYQMQIDAIPKMLFSKEQWHEIQSGINDHDDVWIYADPKFTPEQMSTTHAALDVEYHGYVSREDVLKIADPAKSPEQMKAELKELRKAHIPEEKEQPAQQEDKKAGKKSVMADLRKKQAQVAGKEAQKQPMKSKSKEMD